MDGATAETGHFLSQYEGVVRPDVVNAHAAAWQWIARPGTWMTGAQRCEVVREVRLARQCDLCKQRKNAPLPTLVQGEHNSNDVLTAGQVEAIHKLATDPGRLSKAWLDNLLSAGLTDGVYVETSGIVSIVMTMDTFTWSLGLEDTPVPEPLSGEPSPYRPPGAKLNDCWIATVSLEDMAASDGSLYGDRASGVHRALSLVPPTKIAVFDLQMAHYISPNAIADTSITSLGRDITRPQIEILASRVSVLNQCLF
jgi:hypothetical protein